MSKVHFVERATGRVWSGREVRNIIESWHNVPENKDVHIMELLVKKFAIITGESDDE